MGLSSLNFFQSTCRETVVIKWVQILKGPPPKKKIEMAKNCPKFNAIFDNFRLWSRISPEQEISKISNIENRKSSWKSKTTHVGWKKVVYFGLQTTMLFPLINLHPNGLFSGDYISALRGCYTLNFFTCTIDSRRLASAHPKWGGGLPKKVLIAKI